MSSTTPNIGLTKTTAAETIGQNWAASNDSGGNFDIIDTKMGPVGSQSVQAQLDALNSNKVSIQVVTETGISINAGEHKNFNVPYTSSGTVQAVFVLQTPNSAYIFGSAVSWSANGATIGLYNSAPSTVTGSLVIGILYK